LKGRAVPSNYRDKNGKDPFSDQDGRNPFSEDVDELELPAADGPYGASPAAGDAYHPDDFEAYLPHRGGTILLLGAIGLLGAIAGTAMVFFCLPFGILSLGLALPAWIMGQKDLAAMRMGAMDVSGRGTTLAGMIMAMIGTVLAIADPVLFVGMILWGIYEMGF